MTPTKKHGPGVNWGTTPAQWAAKVKEVVKIFDDCVIKGNGSSSGPTGGWPAEMGKPPPTVGILCLEAYNWQATNDDSVLDCTSSVNGVSFIDTMKDAGYEVGLLTQKSFNLLGLSGIAGSELYNGCIASGGDQSCCTNSDKATCCPARMGYGSPMTAKSIGSWMANSTMWNSKHGTQFSSGSTSFAGDGLGATCPVPDGVSFDDVADYYFSNPNFPKEQDFPCNFGIYGGSQQA